MQTPEVELNQNVSEITVQAIPTNALIWFKNLWMNNFYVVSGTYLTGEIQREIFLYISKSNEKYQIAKIKAFDYFWKKYVDSLDGVLRNRIIGDYYRYSETYSDELRSNDELQTQIRELEEDVRQKNQKIAELKISLEKKNEEKIEEMKKEQRKIEIIRDILSFLDDQNVQFGIAISNLLQEGKDLENEIKLILEKHGLVCSKDTIIKAIINLYKQT